MFHFESTTSTLAHGCEVLYEKSIVSVLNILE